MPRPEPLFSAPGRVFRATVAAFVLTAAFVGASSQQATAKTVDCRSLRSVLPGDARFAADHHPDQSRAATLLFLPGPVRSPGPLLAKELERLDGFATGLFSPTLGRYSPTQMMLDISQGARVASSLYTPGQLASPGLIHWERARLAVVNGWPAIVHRAEGTPSDLRPGALAGEIVRENRFVAWVGMTGTSPVTAIAAASDAPLPGTSGSGCGAIEYAELTPPAGVAKRVSELEGRFDLVIAALPPGGRGLSAVKRLAKARPGRMYVVLQAPPDPAKTRLLPIAVKGVGGRGGLRSATTRRTGLVSAIDVAPTILDRLGTGAPAEMQGRPIEGAERLSAEQLADMSKRLALIADRRLPFGKGAVTIALLLMAIVLLLARAAGRQEELGRKLLRVISLAIFWLALMLMVTAALRPGKNTEVNIAIGGSLALALLTDRFVRWPRAPWVPVTGVLIAHGLDFALFNSRFTGQSLLGSNPIYGARFFGVGNELEAVMSVSALIAVGAFMCDRRIVAPANAFAAGGAALAMYLGIGRIGADVGGVVTVAAGFGVAALYVARTRLTALRVALLAALPILALALIALLDAATGGESHLTRTVLKAESFGDLFTVADRRFRASVEGAKGDGIWMIVILSGLLLAVGWLRRDRLTARLVEHGEDPDSRRPYRAALAGAVAATVIGAAANDSGPAILIIGTIYTLMGLLYLRGRPAGL